MHSDEHTNQPHDHPTDEHGHHVHVTPFWPMLITFVVLLVLTLLTVVTAKGLYFGNAVNLTIALIIAGAKAVLVAAFFMHLLYDKAINTVIVVATMFAVVLFISLTLVDLGTRHLADPIEDGEIVPGGGVQINVSEETGDREIRPQYNPWHSDTPSKSVLQQAREAYEAKHDHDAPRDDHGEHDSPQNQNQNAAADPTDADPTTGAEP